MKQIKIGFLLAYDYELLKTALPQVYNHADKIVLSLDKNRKTYKGNNFLIPDDFFSWLKEFDESNIIDIYEDDFAVPTLSPMECEVRQRRLTAKILGEGGWHLQIDVDEYFLDFGKFIKRLRYFEKRIQPDEKVTVFVNWITLFKKVDEGFLYTKYNGGYELCHIATNSPEYEYGRACTGHKAIISNCFVLHDSWARDENQVYTKLKNWSHSNDFDLDKFYNLWKQITIENYKSVVNFHPINSKLWLGLGLFKGRTMDQIIFTAKNDYEKKNFFWKMILKNIKGGGKILNIIERLFKI